MTDDDYCFSRDDHDMLVELTMLTVELRAIAGSRSWYQRVRFWATLAAAMTFNIGIVLLLGGSARVSANAYWLIATAGGPMIWGAGFITAAILTILCVWRWHHALRWAVLIQAVPYTAVAVSFAAAAFRYPDANLTATPVYGWIAIMHAALSDYARKEF